MRRFGKLRTRLLSSLRKRSPSSRRAERYSNSKDSLNSDGERTPSPTPQLQRGTQQQQQQLHWSEARRIYSEPASRELKVERSSSSATGSSEEENSTITPSRIGRASLSTSSNLTERERNDATVKKLRRNRGRRGRTPCGHSNSRLGTSTGGDTYSSAGSQSDQLQQSADSDAEEDDEDDDDVFLESWEEVAAAAKASPSTNVGSATTLSSSSGISSMRDNVISAASSSTCFIPSNSPQSLVSSSPLFVDDTQRHSLHMSGYGAPSSEIKNENVLERELESIGDVTGGWEEWKIPSSEITLGQVLYHSQLETVYRGYWHGVVHVHTRSVKEVVDVVSFLNEVATLNCIRHENIQLFMGASLDMQCGTVAIVMSELKGSTLSTRLHQLGHAFTAPSKTKILRQIAEGMEYLHAKGISHGLLTSSSITLNCRVCISLAPPHTKHAHRYFTPQELTYLPPECIRQLHVDQQSPVSPVRLVSTSSLGSPSATCFTCEKSSISSKSRAPSSPSLVTMATVGAGTCCCCKIRKRRSNANGSSGCGQSVAGSQLKTKMSPNPPADIFAFGTIVYELLSLERPYKHLPAECLIWQAGLGQSQSITLLPRGRFRNIIRSCWREQAERRPSFTELLVVLEENVVIPMSSKSVSCSTSHHLQPSRSLPSLTSSPNSVTSPSNHFVN